VPGDGVTSADLARAAVALGDALLGLAVVVLGESRHVAANAGFLTRPLSALVGMPVAVGRSLAGQRWFHDLMETGTIQRWQTVDTLRGLGMRWAPPVVDSALDFIDLNDVVLAHVDIDAIVQDLDIAAIVDRLDIDAIVSRVDVDAIVDQLDIDEIVSRVDIGAIVDRLDIDEIVSRVDIGAIVDRLDIDAIVSRVDVDAIVRRVDVNAVVDRADMDAIIARIDIIGIAEYVVEGIDLPGIIRSSTGSMASEGIREVRRQGISADERVAHIVDRLLRRPDRSPGSVNHEPVAVLTAPHEGDVVQGVTTDTSGPAIPDASDADPGEPGKD
jgi:hypothetical protein